MATRALIAAVKLMPMALVRSQLFPFLTRGIYEGSARDDTAVHLCIGCLPYARLLLDRFYRDQFDDRDLWKKCMRGTFVDFWVQALEYITLPRDDAALRALETRLSATPSLCTISPDDELHYPHPLCLGAHRAGSATGLVEETIYLLSIMVVFCMRGFKGDVTDITQFSSKGYWPRSVKDIMPRGSSATVVSLLAWWARATQPIDNEDFSDFFISIAQIRPHEIAIEVIKMKSLFAQIWTTKAIAHGKTVLGFANNDSSNDYTMARRAFGATFDIIEQLIPCLNNISVYAPELFYGHEAAVKDVITVAIHAVQRCGPADHRRVDMFHVFVATVVGSNVPKLLLRARENTRSYRSEPGDGCESVDPYMRFARLMWSYLRRVHCTNPLCLRYGSESNSETQMRLMRCSSCKVAQYCSQDCQRVHWNLPHLSRPHKEICKLYSRISRLDGFNKLIRDGDLEAQASFGSACRAHGLTFDELAFTLVHTSCTRQRISKQYPMEVQMNVTRAILDPERFSYCGED